MKTGKYLSSISMVAEIALTRKQAKCFEVFKVRSIELAPGDKILLLQNRRNFRWLGFRATNGEIATVSSKG